NTAFANPNEYEDIWVNGLSEQAGPIKTRKELPPAVTAAAIDCLIEQNLDKYKPSYLSIKPVSNELLHNCLCYLACISASPFFQRSLQESGNNSFSHRRGNV